MKIDNIFPSVQFPCLLCFVLIALILLNRNDHKFLSLIPDFKEKSFEDFTAKYDVCRMEKIIDHLSLFHMSLNYF